jgi:hypothetical protein
MTICKDIIPNRGQPKFCDCFFIFLYEKEKSSQKMENNAKTLKNMFFVSNSPTVQQRDLFRLLII